MSTFIELYDTPRHSHWFSSFQARNTPSYFFLGVQDWFLSGRSRLETLKRLYQHVGGSIDVDKRAAIDRQRDAGNEICLVGCQKQRSVRDVPRGPHLVTQRDPRIAFGRDLSSAFAGDAGARIDRHRGIYQGRMTFARTPNSAFWMATC